MNIQLNILANGIRIINNGIPRFIKYSNICELGISGDGNSLCFLISGQSDSDLNSYIKLLYADITNTSTKNVTELYYSIEPLIDNTTKINTAQRVIQIVNGGVTTTYFGYAPQGSPTNKAVWMIKQITSTVAGGTTTTDFKWASNSEIKMANNLIFDNYLTYSYEY